VSTRYLYGGEQGAGKERERGGEGKEGRGKCLTSAGGIKGRDTASLSHRSSSCLYLYGGEQGTGKERETGRGGEGKGEGKKGGENASPLQGG